MPDLGKAYVQIVPSAEGISGQIREALGGEADAAGDEAGNKLGSRLVGTIKKVIAAAGIGAALKTAISEGAALEQSLGGVETLFKDSANTVIENAKNAFKTAGLSANEYMENVTSFSASLLQGLGGDTAKAAEVAHKAMTDMSDNANKMGTSMEDIMNAYQGFAKDNYTMLDNLKLGYGGTKEEMARLINDTGVLGDTFVSTGKKGNFDEVVTFDKIIEAIGIVQDKLGITGTTALEAETTISGSFNSMKAAAQNFAGYLSLGMDITPAINNLVTTASTFLFGNLFPAIGHVFTALPGAIGTFVTSAGQVISQHFSLSMITETATAAADFMNSLGSGLSANIPALLAQALPMVLQLSENLRANAGTLVDAGLNMIVQLAQGIANSIPTLVAYIPTIVTNIAGIINDNAPKVLFAAGNIVITLAQGIISAAPQIVAAIPQIIQAIISVFSAYNWVQLGQMIVNGIKSGITMLKSALKSAGENAINLFKSINWSGAGTAVCNFIHNAISGAAGLIGNALRTVGSNGMNAFRSINWGSVGSAAINFIKSAISGAGGLVKSALQSVGQAGMNAFKNISWSSIGSHIISGICRGISGAASTLYNKLRSLASDALNAAKAKLGINSPSRVFRDVVGRAIPEGIGVGVERYSSYAMDAVEKMSGKLTDAAKISTIHTGIKSAVEAQAVKLTTALTATNSAAQTKTESNAKNVYVTYAPVQKFDEPVTLREREAMNRRDARRIARLVANA